MQTEPHRPFKILYATLYYDVRPTFVVDISDQFEANSNPSSPTSPNSAISRRAEKTSLLMPKSASALRPWRRSMDCSQA